MSLFHKIKKWYQGTPVVVDMPSERQGSVVFIGTPFLAGVRYHWSAKLVRAVVNFYIRHWKWIWGLGLSAIVAWLTA